MVGKLNELTQLRDSGFGRPQPRHGLKLLHWFAKDCVSFDEVNNMLCNCDPTDGDFGFHRFVNNWNGKKLLVDKNCTYHVVGNLNVKKYPKAKKHPKYIFENKRTKEPVSNTDRIIVSLHNATQLLGVYVTQHYYQSNSFDPNTTYRISKGLLMIIKRKRLEDFLVEMGYCTHTQPIINYSPPASEEVSPDHTVVSISSSDSSDSELSDDTPAQNNSQNSPAARGLWERFCTIL